MGWEVDPTTGMGFFIDDQTGAMVTPVSTAGTLSPAPVQPEGSPSGIIVPVEGGGWGLLPFSSAPHGVDIITEVPSGPATKEGGVLDPITYVVPRIAPDTPGVEPIDIKEVFPYEPPPGFPYTPPVNVVSSSPTDQKPAYINWLMLFILMQSMNRRRN